MRAEEGKKPRILVVDDDKNLRLLYEEEFAVEGYEVDLAVDGEEALVRMQSVRPDLVILDIRMPGMDGVEALSKMLARDKKLPIIINTAYPSYRDDFMTWAADAYVVKSSDLSELKGKVKELLG